jgi:hypothetical protein
MNYFSSSSTFLKVKQVEPSQADFTFELSEPTELQVLLPAAQSCMEKEN